MDSTIRVVADVPQSRPDGVERVELTEPRRALEAAGATVEPQAPSAGSIQSMDHREKSERLRVDRKVSQTDPREYDGLVLPGGVVNADKLRIDQDAVRFTRALLDGGTPIGVICHGPWILIETGLLRGRVLTSHPTLRTDLRNAGARWVDEEVHTTTAWSRAGAPRICRPSMPRSSRSSRRARTCARLREGARRGVAARLAAVSCVRAPPASRKLPRRLVLLMRDLDEESRSPAKEAGLGVRTILSARSQVRRVACCPCLACRPGHLDDVREASVIDSSTTTCDLRAVPAFPSRGAAS